EMDCLTGLLLDDQRNVFVLPSGPFSSFAPSSVSSSSSTASASLGRVEKFFAQSGQSDEHVAFRMKSDCEDARNGVESSSSSLEIVPFGSPKQTQPTRPSSTSPRSGGSRSSTLS